MSAVRAAMVAPDPGDRTDPSPADTDAAVIERSLAEPERFAGVFDRHYRRVHAFAARRLRVILGQGALPPELRAAVFRAMAQVPGVRVRSVDLQASPRSR
jgi:hypothetical protein